jgi:uncharacterized protein (DUF2336 family)
MKQFLPSEILSQDDFLRLKQNPQPYSRVAIARKIVSGFELSEPDSHSYQMAEEIALYLQRDKHDQVRITLAKGISQSEKVPKQLVLLLANDNVDAVAVPILRDSPLLDEEDLQHLVKDTESMVRLMAIAERRFLSFTISALIVHKGQEQVVITLLKNASAAIDSPTYWKMSEDYRQSHLILKGMRDRIPMPLDAIENLQKAVAKDQENTPTSVKGMPSFTPLSFAEIKQIALLIGTLSEHPIADECLELAGQFHLEKKIHASTLIMALCYGHLGLFCACIAVVVQRPYAEIEEKIMDSKQQNNFTAMLLKAGISTSLLPLLQWVWKGSIARLEQGVKPASRQMTRLMSLHLREGARRGVNFASTLAIPVASVMEQM